MGVRAKTPPPTSVETYLTAGLSRLPQRSHAARERQSDVFRRAVAEWKEDRSPGRRSAIPTIAVAQPVQTKPPPTPRSVASSAARPPVVQPMSTGSARRYDPVRPAAYVNETYYTGGGVQDSVTKSGNRGAMMRSTTPRSFQRESAQSHSAEFSMKASGMAKEQLRRPNSGVGFAMSSPRIAFGASSSDANQRIIYKSLKFSHVQRPAVWRDDVADQRRKARVDRLMIDVRNREVARVVDDWMVAQDVSVADRLEQLGYSTDRAVKLATHLRPDCLLCTLTHEDRKHLEAFRQKLGQACMERLQSLEPPALDDHLASLGIVATARACVVHQLKSVNVDPAEDSEAAHA